MAAASLTTDGEQSLLDIDDARSFLTRIGFAPGHAKLAQCPGLTRAQAVDTAFTSARSEAVSPPPDRVVEPITTRAESYAWTPY